MNLKVETEKQSDNSSEKHGCAGNQDSDSNCLKLQLQSFSYGKVEVLGKLNLAVNHNETVALTGPSGVGKTTLLRVLAGLEPSFSGFLECSVRLAMVFQEPTLLPWRTARENLCLAADIDESAANEALIEVGLENKGNFYPRQLSLGQQRRLSLARAFAVEPDLLLMDEPFVSLDPELAKEMMELFVALKNRRSLATVLVTHSYSEVENLANRSLLIGGSPAQIVEERKLVAMQ